MKLKPELDRVIKEFQCIKHLIPEHVKLVKQEGRYKDLETRIAWDCLRAVMGTKWICNLYDQYDCNDDHITTLAKKALKTVYKLGVKNNEEYQ